MKDIQNQLGLSTSEVPEIEHSCAFLDFQLTIMNKHHTLQDGPELSVHPKRVRDLKDELEALGGVLHSLTDTVGGAVDVDLSALDLSLLRYGKACKDFEQELLKCSSRSNVPTFLDRISRKSSVTAEGLKSYRDLIEAATNGLEAHLESIDEKLESIIIRAGTDTDATAFKHTKVPPHLRPIVGTYRSDSAENQTARWKNIQLARRTCQNKSRAIAYKNAEIASTTQP
ncbi:hypothetical protein B0J11DRAFT_508661 [Dendryphion nanum]|uniref:Azaphilone pigments biosynthesis cluster protein L N-terminal domain-containing protein n=1 Tax=Dendryphion nanum TaxID=256645 RepID=A0A9P9DIP0_9PLEO|nr:hypothetical protein B0J11DRAFT_508661 [Dendryphion nanum]